MNGLQAHSRVFVNRTIIPNPYYGLTSRFLGDP
jgi:hypothetical protein